MKWYRTEIYTKRWLEMEVIEMKVLIIFYPNIFEKRIKTMQYCIYNIHKIKIDDNNIHVCRERMAVYYFEIVLPYSI